VRVQIEVGFLDTSLALKLTVSRSLTMLYSFTMHFIVDEDGDNIAINNLGIPYLKGQIARKQIQPVIAAQWTNASAVNSLSGMTLMLSTAVFFALAIGWRINR
jgi:hypothetical protein